MKKNLLITKGLEVKIKNKLVVKNANIILKERELIVITGANGSGKTSLAMSIAGHPEYKIVKGSIFFEGKEINNLKMGERFKKGIFVAMQIPVEIEGLRYYSFLWNAYKKIYPDANIKEFMRKVEKYAKMLGLKKELLERELNKGFSGGEKKKSEVLQYLVFDPKVAILDEIDSGLDVKSLKKIAKELKKVKKKEGKGIVVITHNPSFIKELKPDRIYFMEEGKIKLK